MPSKSRKSSRSAKSSKPAKRRPVAVTSDILARPPKARRVPAKWKVHYDRLIQVRNALQNRQDSLIGDAREEQSSFSLHMADAATDSFDRDLALSRASSEQEAVLEINEAIDRIHDGTYGFCELTGKPIDSRRLEAIPWTRFSLEAEKMLEKEGSLSRARLGARESVPRTVGSETGSEQNPDQE